MENFLKQINIIAIDCPSNSPDLFFRLPKFFHDALSGLKSKRFSSETELFTESLQAVSTAAINIDWKGWLSDWFERLKLCVERDEDYV